MKKLIQVVCAAAMLGMFFTSFAGSDAVAKDASPTSPTSPTPPTPKPPKPSAPKPPTPPTPAPPRHSL